MLSAVRSATNDFMDQFPFEDKHWSTKLAFLTTDVIRFASAIMRVSQFFEALTPAFRNVPTNRRVQFNHFEVVAAVRLWLRQVHLVRGFSEAVWARIDSEPDRSGHDNDPRQQAPDRSGRN